MIKAIIFDYYGVLTTDEFFTWLQRHPQVLEEHGPEIEQLGMEQDKGLDDDRFFARLGELSGLEPKEIQAEFQVHGVAHEALVKYIRRLRRRGYLTAILSNSGTELYDEVKKHNLTHLFELILCSEEAGVTKPDPKIFKLALDRLGVSPKEALFTDDREYNVKGAAAVGITSLLYSGLTDFRHDLISLGLDEPQD
jgi:HAD superfamily hydrolase (TIGR01509 family)